MNKINNSCDSISGFKKLNTGEETLLSDIFTGNIKEMDKVSSSQLLYFIEELKNLVSHYKSILQADQKFTTSELKWLKDRFEEEFTELSNQVKNLVNDSIGNYNTTKADLDSCFIRFDEQISGFFIDEINKLESRGTVTEYQWDSLFNRTESEKLLNFLVNPTGNGAAYRASAAQLDGKILPLSFYVSPEAIRLYFGDYVGGSDPINSVIDILLDENSGQMGPEEMDSAGAKLQLERINTYYGLNIYDGACWQMAAALAARENFKGPLGESLFSISDNENELLALGYDGDATCAKKDSNRATSEMGFHYQNDISLNGKNAFHFRMIPRTWTQTDPLMDTDGGQNIIGGQVSWADWKPITGENAWAFLIGPLQAAKLKCDKDYVPFKNLGVQNAINILPAFMAMQSKEGAIHYAVGGSLGNTGDEPVDESTVSTENNSSALAGLLLLQDILRDAYAKDPSLSKKDRDQIKQALFDLDVMIYGGKTTQGNVTNGLLSFFANDVLYGELNQDIGFYQGGNANGPLGDWIPTKTPMAVDCQTWTLSVLGQPFLDEIKGYGASYQIFENTLRWGGYYDKEGKLKGVGYSDADGNGPDHPSCGLISAEWTAAAINTCRSLIQQYSDGPDHPEKEQMIRTLTKQMHGMQEGLLSLRTDNYAKDPEYAEVRPSAYEQMNLLADDSLSFLYASKRYEIPFGWFANPIPSTTSTAWALYLNYNYNPLSLDGSYRANDLSRKPLPF